MQTREYNFDGLVGPTHNYAGLSYGNVASSLHQSQTSKPRQAALQGLEKMRRLSQMGIGQAVLPPLPRPRLDFLQSIGFSGAPEQLIANAANTDPTLLACAYSASNMWTANAATVSPACESLDDRLQLTVANLSSGLHRSIEADQTWSVLKQVFADQACFQVHPPLSGTSALTDEGAANHTRLTVDHGQPGIQIFVFGRSALNQSLPLPRRFPARQTLEACQAIVRTHRLDPDRVVLAQQNPEAIDAGVFHNDVISVGNQNVLLCHELSFYEQRSVLEEVRRKFLEVTEQELVVCELKSKDIPIEDCVVSYLFNSQLITRPDNRMSLICPTESRDMPSATAATKRIMEQVEPIDDVQFFDLRQSMNNGGGPACLRLRVVLTDRQVGGLHRGVVFTQELYSELKDCINQHYRETLTPDDLKAPAFYHELQSVYDEIYRILRLNRPDVQSS